MASDFMPLSIVLLLTVLIDIASMPAFWFLRQIGLLAFLILGNKK